MSVLGKDLFDFQRSHTNTKVEFGASGYWVEMVPEMQPYDLGNRPITKSSILFAYINT